MGANLPNGTWHGISRNPPPPSARMNSPCRPSVMAYYYPVNRAQQRVGGSGWIQTRFNWNFWLYISRRHSQKNTNMPDLKTVHLGASVSTTFFLYQFSIFARCVINESIDDFLVTDLSIGHETSVTAIYRTNYYVYLYWVGLWLNQRFCSNDFLLKRSFVKCNLWARVEFSPACQACLSWCTHG